MLPAILPVSVSETTCIAMGPQGYDPVDLQRGPSTDNTYPPHHHVDEMSIPLTNLQSGSSSRLAKPTNQGYDPERAAGSMPEPQGSWLSGIKKIEQSYQEFDPARNASESHLAFADGDLPKNEVCCPRATFTPLLTSLWQGLEIVQLSPQRFHCVSMDIVHRPSSRRYLDPWDPCFNRDNTQRPSKSPLVCLVAAAERRSYS